MRFDALFAQGAGLRRLGVEALLHLKPMVASPALILVYLAFASRATISGLSWCLLTPYFNLSAFWASCQHARTRRGAPCPGRTERVLSNGRPTTTMLNHACHPARRRHASSRFQGGRRRTLTRSLDMPRALMVGALLAFLCAAVLIFAYCDTREDSHGDCPRQDNRRPDQERHGGRFLLSVGRRRGDVELHRRWASGVHAVPPAGAYAHGRGRERAFQASGRCPDCSWR